MNAYTLMQKLTVTRVKGGANAVESAAMLSDLIASHKGDNLATALLYNGFVKTEAAAYRATNVLSA